MSTEPTLLPLQPTRLQPAGHFWRIFNLVAPMGTTFEQLTAPEFLRLCGAELRPLDRIECVDDACTWFVELLVVSVNPGIGVQTRRIRGGMLEGMGAPDAAACNRTGARVEYRGPALKWCVMRGEETLRDGFATEGQAAIWLAQYNRTTQGAA